jgi:hypothetical protein
MSIGTKIKVWATTAAIGLALLFIYGVQDLGKDGGDDNYVLSSKWMPGVMPMHSDVIITVSVDGFPMPALKRRLSPYSETMTAAKGAVITLTVISSHYRTEFLDCVIMRNGRSVPSGGFDSRPGPGSVRCVA